MAFRIFLLLSVASLIVLAYGSLFPEKRAMNMKREVCTSKECKDRAQMILSFVDQEANPCEDFYAYACGKHLKSRTEEVVPDGFTVMEDETRKTIRDIVLNYPNITEPKNFTEKVMMMNQACLHSDLTEDQELEAIKVILGSQGYDSWPLLGNGKTTVKKFRDLKDLLLATPLQHLFAVYASNDPFNRSTNIIWMSFGTQKLSTLRLNLTGRSDNSTRQIKALEEVLKVTAHRFRPNASNEDLYALAKDAIRIQAELDQFTNAPQRQWRKRIQEAEESLPSFPVLELLNGFVKGINITLRYDDFVFLDNLEALNKTVQFLLREDVNSIYNYMGLHRAVLLLNQSSPTYRQETASIFKDHQIKTPQYSRAEACMELVARVPTVLTRIYVQHNLDFSKRVAARSILNSIGGAYYRNLRFIPWMDRATKLEAIEKLRKMQPVLGSSDTLMDDTKIDSSFHLLNNIRRNMSISTILYFLEKNLVETNLLKLKGTDPFVYEKHYEDVNAYYFPLENKMVIPAGVLHGILFSKGLPRYLNLGAVGFIVGHEITHGFDTKGSRYDGLGQRSNWWSNYTRQEFEEKANCFARQYARIIEPLTNKTLHGRQILTETTADNGGIRVAFRAFQLEEVPEVALPGLEHFTSEQLFFVSFAMPWCSRVTRPYVEYLIELGRHAPHKYRVNVPLQNMEEFSAAFQCKNGSAMRLSYRERCVLW